MECLVASRSLVWCGSAGNNSKVVRCGDGGDIGQVGCDRLVFGCVVDRWEGLRIERTPTHVLP